MFIDTHVHLTDEVLFSRIDEIRANYLNAGVKKVITVGYNLASSVKAKELSEKYNEIYFAVGVHPSDAVFYNDKTEKLLRSLCAHPKCLAVGEIGLDYHYEGYDKLTQINAFISQLKLANEVGLPVIIHSRDACKDTVDILKENSNLLGNGFLMHCFSESKETAMQLLPLGGYFAFGGAITYKNAKKQEVISAIPKNRLFAETDCPYLTPVPKRGEKNQPANVTYVYDFIANTLGVSVDEIKTQFANNFNALFKKA